MGKRNHCDQMRARVICMRPCKTPRVIVNGVHCVGLFRRARPASEKDSSGVPGMRRFCPPFVNPWLFNYVFVVLGLM